ncbi:MAG: hypothetical protein [Circular genetic element sp.]|nr:MAG: hypothetical protein [Circular genetic element sp.]
MKRELILTLYRSGVPSDLWFKIWMECVRGGGAHYLDFLTEELKEIIYNNIWDDCWKFKARGTSIWMRYNKECYNDLYDNCPNRIKVVTDESHWSLDSDSEDDY